MEHTGRPHLENRHASQFSLAYGLLFFILPFGFDALTNVVLLGVLIFSLFRLRRTDWRHGLTSPFFLAPAALFLFYLTSMLWTSNLDSGWRNLETKLGLLLITFVISSTRPRVASSTREKVLRWFIYGNLAVLALAFSIAFYNLASTGSFTRLSPGGTFRESYFTYKVLAEPFMHPGYLATYVGFAVLGSIYFILKTTRTPAKAGWGLAIAFLFLGMLMLQGRINLIALFLVLVAGALIFVIRTRAYVWLLLPALPTALVIILLLWGPPAIRHRYLQLPDFSYDISGTDFNSATYRLAEWAGAAEVISDYPWLGAGAGDKMPELLAAYEEIGFYEGLEERFNAHNQYIETAMATGFVGLILLLLLLSLYSLRAIRSRDWLNLSVLAFFMLCMLTESMLERAWAVILFSSYFPFFIRESKQETSN